MGSGGEEAFDGKLRYTDESILYIGMGLAADIDDLTTMDEIPFVSGNRRDS